jgi:tripeptide aminopeptidase
MASRIQTLLNDPTHAAVLRTLKERTADQVERVLSEALTIQSIPAPTFHEAERAAYVQKRFEGLEHVEIDDVFNVYGCLPGRDRNRPAVLVSAHTDTVFDFGVPLRSSRVDGRINAPGIGDNSLGVAALLGLMDLLREQFTDLPADVWFVANSREEGLGDLGGIKAVVERLRRKLGTAVVIEGMALGRVYHGGIAVRRLKITCHGPGGHSWLHFGRPSAIHHLMKLGTQITALSTPENPRTTFNIGMIEGGLSVNTIASSASMLLDMRSEERDTLATLERSVMNLIHHARVPDISFTVDVVGDRPAGSIPRSHPLVQTARDVLDTIGIQTIYEIGSTDANALLAAGVPTVTVGITHGGNAHRTDEYIEVDPVGHGMWQLALLTIAAAYGLAE